MSVTRSATAGDPTSAGNLAQSAANAAAAQLEAENKASWQANQKAICGTQSQPSWAPSNPITADKNETGGSTGSNADGDSTVKGSDDPDRSAPDEDDYDDPIQGTNPEPRDDSGGTSEPPPPAPAPSTKPTSPNGPLR